MKWIGQYIQSLISRFRNDVYLENTVQGDSDPDRFLAIDANGKIIYRDGEQVLSDIGGTSSTGDITSVTFQTDTGAGGLAVDDSGDAYFRLVGANGVGITNSSTTMTAVAVAGEIDHDALSNFVAAEHVDWAGASAGTIHATNYTNTQYELATDSAAGITELATTAEASAGTDTTRVVTPAGLETHVNDRYSYQYIHIAGNATISTNWATGGNNGPNSWNWNYDTGVSAVDIGTSHSFARSKITGNFVVPFDGVLVGFYGIMRNNTADNQGALGLFHSAYSTYGASSTTSAFTLQAYATADKTGGAGSAYEGPCKVVDLGRSLALTAGDTLIPAVLLANEKAYLHMTIVIKTKIPT